MAIKKILIIAVLVILIGLFVWGVAEIVSRITNPLITQPTSLPGNVKELLRTDSYGFKVYRIETDGQVFLVGSQGGICKIDTNRH